MISACVCVSHGSFGLLDYLMSRVGSVLGQLSESCGSWKLHALLWLGADCLVYIRYGRVASCLVVPFQLKLLLKLSALKRLCSFHMCNILVALCSFCTCYILVAKCEVFNKSYVLECQDIFTWQVATSWYICLWLGTVETLIKRLFKTFVSSAA